MEFGKTISSPEFASAGNVTAIDDIDGNIPVSCDGWYGINWQEGFYSLGTTTVTCSATDSSENEGSASFTITVTEAFCRYTYAHRNLNCIPQRHVTDRQNSPANCK